MADNVGYTSGTGTIVATDDVGGVQYQRVKSVWGGDGVANDVSATKPMPVNCPNIYETVAASQTAQVLGAGAGAAGDYIAGVLIVPASTSPGAVTLLDGATSIVIFTGGASSVSNLVPFYVPLGMIATSGWKLTTGASVSCVATGAFT